VGKSHAASVGTDGSFHPSQSGTFDTTILCASCDGKLGQVEDHVARLCLAIRQQTTGAQPFGSKTCPGADKDIVRRFCAGILWKYSITSEKFGRLDLFRYQDDVRRLAYGEIGVPSWFDVALFRLRVHEEDKEPFAYRAPVIDRKGRVRLYRFLLGGILFFVKIHNKKMRPDALSDLWLSNAGALRFALAPAQSFEEFRLAARLATAESTLSAFLDKQDMSRS
jgi:hypothetical protein